MYLPGHFKEDRPEVLLPFIQEYPLGVLVTVEKGEAQANHLPWLHENQTLQAHIPKVNPLYQYLVENKTVEVLVIFQGPHAYITPSWYPTKKQTGKVVPTWNYSVVHVRGILGLQEDTDWIRTHLEKATNWHEAKRDSTWQMSDAPKEYTDSMMGMLTGLEIKISSMIGKFKLSQNRLELDRVAVMEHLGASSQDEDLKVAALAKRLREKP
jgi:transcriptional regulator